MTYLEKAQEFQKVLAEKGNLEAFERFYGENVTVEEVPAGLIRNGKEEQRKAINQFFANVEEFHGGGVEAITSNEDEAITMIESWFDITFKGGGRKKMKEVGIQKWSGDHIISEKFYFNAPS